MGKTGRPVSWGSGQARDSRKLVRVSPRVTRVKSMPNQDTSTAHFIIIRLLSWALRLAGSIVSIHSLAVPSECKEQPEINNERSTLRTLVCSVTTTLNFGEIN